MRVTIPTVDQLGCGLTCPFRFTSTQDFASASSTIGVKSDVQELLGIVQGEVWWRQGLGTRLTRLRHRANTGALADLARIDVARALATYEPRVKLRAVYSPAPLAAAPTKREIHVHYEVAGRPDVAKTTF